MPYTTAQLFGTFCRTESTKEQGYRKNIRQPNKVEDCEYVSVGKFTHKVSGSNFRKVKTTINSINQ